MFVNLRDICKSERNLLKILVREHMCGRFTGLQPEIYYKYFLINFVYNLGTPPMTSDRKEATLKFNAYYVTQGILFLLFSRYRFVRLTERRWTFYKNKNESFDQ